MTRIAVVQPARTLGEVERNVARIEDLIRDAHREHGADVVVVPEGLTTPNVYAKVMRSTPRPVDGQPLQMLTRLARELDCVVAGGFVAIRAVLVEIFGPAGAQAPILYGGSVKPSNAEEILHAAEVGGALVGGASLKADDFLGIIRAA